TPELRRTPAPPGVRTRPALARGVLWGLGWGQSCEPLPGSARVPRKSNPGEAVETRRTMRPHDEIRKRKRRSGPHAGVRAPVTTDGHDFPETEHATGPAVEGELDDTRTSPE